jgi:hypothetical protein
MLSCAGRQPEAECSLAMPGPYARLPGRYNSVLDPDVRLLGMCTEEAVRARSGSRPFPRPISSIQEPS